MITTDIKDIIKNNEMNENQKKYEKSIKKFCVMINDGKITKRENQLFVDITKIKYNI